jgi:subtilisin family serine protease
MAAPHVAGYAAYLLTLDSSLTPDAVRSTINSNALTNVLSGIRKLISPPASTSPTRN